MGRMDSRLGSRVTVGLVRLPIPVFPGRFGRLPNREGPSIDSPVAYIRGTYPRGLVSLTLVMRRLFSIIRNGWMGRGLALFTFRVITATTPIRVIFV